MYGFKDKNFIIIAVAATFQFLLYFTRGVKA